MKNYWKMTDEELEKEAGRHHIEEYGYAIGGKISRKIIIEQLLAMDSTRNAKSSKRAMVVSISIALINVILIIVNLMLKN